VFEKYQGGVLPPAAALERDFVALGVMEKQKERARQILERSAGRPEGRFQQWGQWWRSNTTNTAASSIY
jgi:hypothetical protein